MVSGYFIGLEYTLSASDKEVVSATDLLNFAKQIAYGMVSRCSNGVLNYSIIVMRNKSTILNDRLGTFCFVGISFVKSYNPS